MGKYVLIIIGAIIYGDLLYFIGSLYSASSPRSPHIRWVEMVFESEAVQRRHRGRVQVGMSGEVTAMPRCLLRQ